MVVGALARIDTAERAQVEDCLADLEGVSTFPLPAEGQLGVLIEADSLDGAPQRPV